MADQDRILRILLQLTSDTSGAQQVSGALSDIDAQTERMMERRVTMETQLEAAEARLGGNTAVADKLEREVAIRARALTVQRTLNVSTEESIALAERLVLAQEASVVPTAAMGVNLGKARAEAIVLGRELASGTVRASTMSSLLGSLGTTFTLAGIAAFELWRVIKGQVDDTQKYNQELAKLPVALNNASGEWDKLATRAETFSDTVTMGEKVGQDLAKMTADMAAFRARQLPLWQRFWDDLVTHNDNAFDANGPLGKSNQGGLGPYEAARQKAALDEQNRQLAVANAALDKNIQSTTDWAAAEANLPVGIANYTAKLADAQAKLAQLDKDRHAGVQGALQAELEELGVVGDLKNKVGELTGEQAKFTAEAQRSANALNALKDNLSVAHAYAYGTRDDAYKAEWGAKYNKILQERQKIGADTSAQAINSQIYDEQLEEERKKVWAEEDRASSKSISNRRTYTAELRQESDALKNIRTEQQLIDQNPFLSADDKQAAQHNLALREQVALMQEMDRIQKDIAGKGPAGPLDPGQLEQAKQKLHQCVIEYLQLETKAQTTSFGGALRADLTSWANQFGATVHQISGLITGTLNTAIGSTSQALTALIFKTGNWKQAFASAAQSIVQNIIQIALQWVVSRTLMSALNAIFGKADAQVATEASGAAFSAWEPAAIAADTASYGAASAAALISFGAAVAGGQAFGAVGAVSGGGLAEGGLVPGSPSARDNRIAMVATGEYVHRSAAVQHYGVDFMHALNNMTFSVPRFADGGLVGNVASGSASSQTNSKRGDTHVFVLMNEDELRKRILASDAGRKIVIDHFRGRRLDLGIS